MVKKIEKPDVTVQQFAEEIGVTPDRLLTQFKDAGIILASKEAVISEEQKQQLLRYLQQHHGAKQDVAPDKIVLRRAKTSEIKIGGSHGASKTVSVQVRKKRTYVKRVPGDEDAGKAVEEVVQAPVADATTHSMTSEQVESPVTTATSAPELNQIPAEPVGHGG